MTGRIVKGISGFYYVYVAGSGIYECRARGVFRQKKMKPLVGDTVEIDVLSEADREGNLKRILPRKSELIRPAVANVDQALVIFACRDPEPNFQLLDRFLVMMEMQNISVLICFNKRDLASEKEQKSIREIYASAGYPVFFTSALDNVEVDILRGALRGKTTTVAGPSGVGKSSLVNLLLSESVMETGEISEKIRRGRHTTRHSELLYLEPESFIVDTPGFSSLYLPEMEKDMLRECYPEFAAREGSCRFLGCSHTHEPDCGVKAAVEAGEISPVRYENYVYLYQELEQRKKY